MIKDILYDFGKGFPYLLLVLYYHAFFVAFSHPTKSVLIKIDMFGEAFIEAIVLILFIPIMVYSIRRSRDERKIHTIKR